MKKIALLLNVIVLVAVAVGWLEYFNADWVVEPSEKYLSALKGLSITSIVTIWALLSKEDNTRPGLEC